MNTHMILAAFVFATIVVVIQCDGAAGEDRGVNAVQGNGVQNAEGANRGSASGQGLDTAEQKNQVGGEGTAAEEGVVAKKENDESNVCLRPENKALKSYLGSILGPENGGESQEVENQVKEKPLECTPVAVNKSKELFGGKPTDSPCHHLMFHVANPKNVTEADCLKSLEAVNSVDQKHIQKTIEEAKKAKGYGCSIKGPLGVCCLLKNEDLHHKEMIEKTNDRDQRNPDAATAIGGVNKNHEQHMASLTK